ncbi:hypothetical protein [Erwinia billingiae]|uniref:hypothetical protein n=1 Tax=Erwinia billingiae TaxID=182337 RepID=UPI000D002566|nr:hypothetical protein [Erwinia billingiae]MBN7121338.1 hypothetical protein [Erwinia billingiae]PRB61290.1 hypothetical protein CQ001_06025 [Erwinia billingiae]
MKKINVRYSLMLAVLLICAALGYFLSQKTLYKEDSFFCTSSFAIHSDNEVLNLSINFNLNHGDGFTTMNGTFFRDGIKQSTVSLQKEFLYTQKDGEFAFTQKPDGVLELNGSDPAVLKKYLPDFYLSNTAGPHHVRIKKLRPGVWIFTTTPTPYLVCTEY